MENRNGTSFKPARMYTIILVSFLHLEFSLLIVPGILAAQNTDNSSKSWTFISRLAASSISEESDPQGYKVYSSVAVHAALRWIFINSFALEMNLNTESREVDYVDPEGHEVSLGSLDMIPINLLLQYHPALYKTIHPYIGVGINLTRFFEKSGGLNAQRIPNSTGAVFQLGSDFDISSYAQINVDIKSIMMSTTIGTNENEKVRLNINPFSISLGLGFRL